MSIKDAEVKLWNTTIGAVTWLSDRNCAAFEYEKKYLGSRIEIAPLKMPLSESIFMFPHLSKETFRGLPGLLADSLPDKFGNAVIGTWLAREGRVVESVNPVERLCYVGNRGMGALEFFPAVKIGSGKSKKIEVSSLVELASSVLNGRINFSVSLQDPVKEEALNDILRVGTSAGGARAKAIIAWNPETKELRSGQIEAGKGFEYWLLKLDGVSRDEDTQVKDPKGYGAIEYAYHLMAKEAGIQMSQCELFEENGRRHFMTKRFDRLAKGEKLHMQSLGALQHFDFNMSGAYAYEQALLTIRMLKLSEETVEEQFRRMVFNVLARNQDDHVKNIAFLMDKSGDWSLSPAFDVIYSYNSSGDHTATHQMTINGKQDDFVKKDFLACAKSASMSSRKAETIINKVLTSVLRWEEFANEVKIPEDMMLKIKNAHRTKMRGL